MIGDRIARPDVDAICDRVSEELGGSGACVLLCEVSALTDADLLTVDALARLQLGARRLGCDMRLEHAPPELRDLLSLLGLQEVVRCAEESGLDARGQAERREKARGVEEERDAGDPTT